MPEKPFFKERIPHFGRKYMDLSPQERDEVQQFWALPTGIHIRRCSLEFEAAGKQQVDLPAEYFDGEEWKQCVSNYMDLGQPNPPYPCEDPESEQVEGACMEGACMECAFDQFCRELWLVWDEIVAEREED